MATDSQDYTPPPEEFPQPRYDVICVHCEHLVSSNGDPDLGYTCRCGGTKMTFRWKEPPWILARYKEGMQRASGG